MNDERVEIHEVRLDGDYTEEDVSVLRDAAHIRRRPNLYIGGTGVKGLHHLVYELLSNSVDEALAGYCKHIHVRIKNDGSLSVNDDGRGIPVEEHALEKKSTLEVVMTIVGAGAKFDNETYKRSAGMHGMGAKAVTALSEWTEVQVYRNSRVYRQEYERGKAVSPVTELGTSNRTGTTVTFKPDPEIFKETQTFDYETLENRLRDLAFLNTGLTLTLHDERTNKDASFCSQGGLTEFMAYMNREETPLHETILLDKRLHQGVEVSLAMQYTASEEKDRYRCYANMAYNVNGGTHLTGFRTGLTRALKAYGTKQELFTKVTPEPDDFREGLALILSVQTAEPAFDSQDKNKLVTAEVEGPVSTVVAEFLGKFLEENPKVAQVIMKKVVLAAEAREAATRAKNDLKKRKGILSNGGLPGKLFDCTNRDRDGSELFLVEGDSAGGSAVEGRDSNYQAILPLRGKVLNVEKARVEKQLENKEICSLISAIGMDIGHNEDEDALKKVRYSRIIILTDADVDGQHIRTLLLTFFYRQMLRLVEEGFIYVARPPLYKVTQKKQVRFVQDAEEMDQELLQRGLKDTKLTVLPHGEPGASATGASAQRQQVLEGEALTAFLKVMAKLETSLANLERSGVNLTAFIGRANKDGLLPMHEIILSGHDEWFFTLAERDAFLQRKKEELGHDLIVADEAPVSVNGHNGHNGHANGGAPVGTYFYKEWHEVPKVNRALEELRRNRMAPSDLVPAPRIAGREPPPRLILESGEHKRPLPHLRELVLEVRRLGERGMTITRFKGLGEMDPTELWETTLDPEHRTVLQVRLDDATEADKMFRQLMGEKVEERKEFIMKYGVNAKDLDLHGA
jgi:DNA gyrase subunit B